MAKVLEFCLPATPSWNCSSIFDVTADGIVCFGGKSNVYCWDARLDNTSYPFPIARHSFHVVGVNFYGNVLKEKCKVVSASENGEIIQTKFGLNGENVEILAEITTNQASCVEYYRSFGPLYLIENSFCMESI